MVISLTLQICRAWAQLLNWTSALTLRCSTARVVPECLIWLKKTERAMHPVLEPPPPPPHSLWNRKDCGKVVVPPTSGSNASISNSGLSNNGGSAKSKHALWFYSISSWRSCPRRVNAGNKKHTQHAPSTKTECDYLNGWIKKRSHTQKSHPKVVNPRDIAGERKKKKKKKKVLTMKYGIFFFFAVCRKPLPICHGNWLLEKHHLTCLSSVKPDPRRSFGDTISRWVTGALGSGNRCFPVQCSWCALSF